MIKLDLHPNEFLCLYDLLSLQQLESGQLILQSLKGRMKEILLQLLKEKSDLQFKNWERQQLEKLNEIK